MEKKTTRKTAKTDDRKKILESFIQYVLENGREPVSVFKFAQSIKIKEADYYTYFSSFDGVKAAVWQSVFEQTKEVLESQEIYGEYSAREKLLAFFYTWIEELKKHRSYLLVLYGKGITVPGPLPSEMNGFKKDFKVFAKEILDEGEEHEEIAKRPYISEKYDEALWIQVIFVFRFWIKDHSSGFEKTDEAIEKSVNLAFDLMGKSALDSFVDFAKFLYQSK